MGRSISWWTVCAVLSASGELFGSAGAVLRPTAFVSCRLESAPWSTKPARSTFVSCSHGPKSQFSWAAQRAACLGRAVSSVKEQEQERDYALTQDMLLSESALRSFTTEATVSEYGALSSGAIVRIRIGNVDLARKAWKKRRRSRSPLLVPCSILGMNRSWMVRWNVMTLVHRYGQRVRETDVDSGDDDLESIVGNDALVLSLPRMVRLYQRDYCCQSFLEHVQVLGYESVEAMLLGLFDKSVRKDHGVEILRTSSGELLLVSALPPNLARRSVAQSAMLQFTPPEQENHDDDDDDLPRSGTSARMDHTGVIRFRLPADPTEHNNDGENGADLSPPRRQRPRFSVQPLGAAVRVPQSDSGSHEMQPLVEGQEYDAFVLGLDPKGDGGSPLLTLTLEPARGQIRDRMKRRQRAKRVYATRKVMGRVLQEASNATAFPSLAELTDLSDLRVGDGPITARVVRLSTKSQAAFVDCNVGRQLGRRFGGGTTRVLGMLRFDDLLPAASKTNGAAVEAEAEAEAWMDGDNDEAEKDHDDDREEELHDEEQDEEYDEAEDEDDEEYDEEEDEDDEEDFSEGREDEGHDMLEEALEEGVQIQGKHARDDMEDDEDDDLTVMSVRDLFKLEEGEDAFGDDEEDEDDDYYDDEEDDVDYHSMEGQEEDGDSYEELLSDAANLDAASKLRGLMNDGGEGFDKVDLPTMLDSGMVTEDDEMDKTDTVATDVQQVETEDEEEDRYYEREEFLTMTFEDRIRATSAVLIEKSRKTFFPVEGADNGDATRKRLKSRKPQTRKIQKAGDVPALVEGEYQEPAYLALGDKVEVYVKAVSPQSGRYMLTLDPTIQGRKPRELKREKAADKRLSKLAQRFGGEEGLERISNLVGTECRGVVKAASKAGDWFYVEPLLDDDETRVALPVGVAMVEEGTTTTEPVRPGDSVRVRLNGIDETRGQLSMTLLERMDT